MSKISDAIKEIQEFSGASTKAAIHGETEDILEALNIARLFIERTVIFLQDLRKNPLKLAYRVLTGGRLDPYEDLRSTVRAFVAKWSVR